MTWILALALSAELDAATVRADDPVLYDSLITLQPTMTRAGFPRFSHPDLAQEGAAEVFAVRLQEGGEAIEVRAALASTLAYSADPDLLLQLIDQEEDPLVRMHLLAGLEKLEPDLALPVLTAGLRDSSVGIRVESARVLSLREDCALAAPELIAALSDPEPEVRAMAARALGWHHIEEGFDPLLPLLSDVDTKVRLQAVRSLGRIDAERAGPLVAPLVDDADPNVARKAASIAGSP